MADPKFNELAADIDDASAAAEELQVDHNADAGETLDDLRKTLEHAADMIDEIGDKGEKEWSPS
jgi:soluble cytochrome b562